MTIDKQPLLKRWRVISTEKCLREPLSLRCQGNHQHGAVSGQDAVRTGLYTRKLARAVANAVLKQLIIAPVEMPKPEEETDSENDFQQPSGGFPEYWSEPTCDPKSEEDENWFGTGGSSASTDTPGKPSEEIDHRGPIERQDKVEQPPNYKGEDVKVRKLPKQPTSEERSRREVTHIPYQPWCRFCCMGKGKETPHYSRTLKRSHRYH